MHLRADRAVLEPYELFVLYRAFAARRDKQLLSPSHLAASLAFEHGLTLQAAYSFVKTLLEWYLIEEAPVDEGEYNKCLKEVELRNDKRIKDKHKYCRRRVPFTVKITDVGMSILCKHWEASGILELNRELGEACAGFLEMYDYVGKKVFHA